MNRLSNDTKKARQANFELLRIVAMLMVVTLHTILNIIKDDSGLSAWYYCGVWLIEALCYAAVDLYVMISGYFLIKSRFSWKRVFFTMAESWFYSVGLYGIWIVKNLISEHSIAFSIKDFVKSYLLPTLTGSRWFVTCYILLIVISPFLNLMIRALSKRTLRGLLTTLLAVFSVLPTILSPIVGSAFSLEGGYSVAWFVILYTLAAYLRLYGLPKWTRPKSILIYFCSAAASMALRFGQAYLPDRLINRKLVIINTYQYNSVTTVLCAVALFCFFAQIEIHNERLNRIIGWLSSHSFSVYLIHTHQRFGDISPIRLSVIMNYINQPIAFLVIPALAIGFYLTCCLIDQVRAWLFIPLQRSKRLNALFAKLDAKTNAMLSPAESPDGSDG